MQVRFQEQLALINDHDQLVEIMKELQQLVTTEYLNTHVKECRETFTLIAAKLIAHELDWGLLGKLPLIILQYTMLFAPTNNKTKLLTKILGTGHITFIAKLVQNTCDLIPLPNDVVEYSPQSEITESGFIDKLIWNLNTCKSIEEIILREQKTKSVEENKAIIEKIIPLVEEVMPKTGLAIGDKFLKTNENFVRAPNEILTTLLISILLNSVAYFFIMQDDFGRNRKHQGIHYKEFIRTFSAVLTKAIANPDILLRLVPCTYEQAFAEKVLLGSSLLRQMNQAAIGLADKNLACYAVHKDSPWRDKKLNKIGINIINDQNIETNEDLYFTIQPLLPTQVKPFKIIEPHVVINYSLLLNNVFLELAAFDNRFSATSLREQSKETDFTQIQLFTQDLFPKIYLEGLINKMSSVTPLIAKNIRFDIDIIRSGLLLSTSVVSPAAVFFQLYTILIMDYLRIYHSDHVKTKRFCEILSKFTFFQQIKENKEIPRYQKLAYLMAQNPSFFAVIFNNIYLAKNLICQSSLNLKKLEAALIELDKCAEDVYEGLNMVSTDLLAFLQYEKRDIQLQASRMHLTILSSQSSILAMIAKQLTQKQIAYEYDKEKNVIFIKNFRHYTKPNIYNFYDAFEKDYRQYMKSQHKINVPEREKKVNPPKPESTNLNSGFMEEPEQKIRKNHVEKASINQYQTQFILSKLDEKKNKKLEEEKTKKKKKQSESKRNKQKLSTITTTAPAAPQQDLSPNPPPAIEIVTVNPIHLSYKTALNIPFDKLENIHLALACNYFLQLESITNEVATINKAADLKSDSMLNLRHHLIYNALRLLQTLASYLEENSFKNQYKVLYKNIIHLRHILAHRMDVFLNYEGEDEKCFYQEFNSVLKIAMRLAKQLEAIVKFTVMPEAVNLENNKVIAQFLKNGQLCIENASRAPLTLLKLIDNKIKNCMAIYLGPKVKESFQLDLKPFDLSVIKLSIAEIGNYAKELRDQHTSFLRKYFNVELRNYKQHLFNKLEKVSRVVPLPSRVALLPNLRDLNSADCREFLNELSFTDMLMLAIEIRNNMAHDTTQDYTFFPEEISTALTFDIAKYFMVLQPRMAEKIASLSKKSGDLLEQASRFFPLPPANAAIACFKNESAFVLK